MDPARSLLFVPGNREDWLDDAHTHGADVVILDLEDSVPPGEKERARDLVAAAIPRLAERGQRVAVRVNGHPKDPTEHTARDLEAVCCDALEAVFVPKVRRPADVVAVDEVLSHVERRDGITATTDLVLALETALGVRNTYDCCTASDRVAAVVCGAVPGTDLSHDVGFEYTGPGREGLETVHLREKVVLDARAAGIDHPLAGTYVDIEDIEGLRSDLAFAREMGYLGYVLVHPSHVEHANEVFTPDAEDVEYWLGVVEALTEGGDAGGTARYEGEMVDEATLATARTRLDRARVFREDLDVEVPDTSTDRTTE